MKSYEYWRDHGTGWMSEYNHRATFIPYFNIQKILIASVACRAAPVSILEYGSGVGRHLQYLHNIPGVSVFGYDQSPTMTAEIEQWAPAGFVADRVLVGNPVQRLPFADGQFDIVFTSEVLVHVHPDDVATIIKELLRVSSKLVFHLEPDKSTPLNPDDHAGCWGHDLVEIYSQLGVCAKAMPRLYDCQLPVVVERTPNTIADLWPPETVSKLFRNLEANLRPTLDAAVSDGVLDVDWDLELNAAIAGGELPRLPRNLLANSVGALIAERDLLANQLQHAQNFRDYIEFVGFPLRRVKQMDRLHLKVIDRNPESHGSEVWLRSAKLDAAGPAIPWSTLKIPQGWSLKEAPGCVDDLALLGDSGEVVLPAGPTPMLNFMCHPWSGRVEIKWKKYLGIIDLFSSDTCDKTVDLQRLAGGKCGCD